MSIRLFFLLPRASASVVLASTGIALDIKLQSLLPLPGVFMLPPRR
jgi:hypothetical protein